MIDRAIKNLEESAGKLMPKEYIMNLTLTKDEEGNWIKTFGAIPDNGGRWE
jgi:hypothetical protein